MNQSDRSESLRDNPASSNMVSLELFARITQSPPEKRSLEPSVPGTSSSSPDVKRAKSVKSPKSVGKQQSLAKDKKLTGRKSQYIKKRRLVGKAGGVGNLPYSGKLQCGGDYYMLHGEGGLLTSSDRYVAQVRIEQSSELDQANSFVVAKRLLLKNLRVVRVLLDENNAEVEKAWKKRDGQLRTVFGKTIDDDRSAEDLFQLERLLSGGEWDWKKVGAEIKKNGSMSQPTKQILLECIEAESKQTDRSKLFKMDTVVTAKTKPQSGKDILRQNVERGICIYRTKIVEKCPDFMKDHLEKLQGSHVLLVTEKDLLLLSDLCRNPEYKVSVNLMPQRYFNMVQNMKPDQLLAVRSTTNQILLYLFKSLSEIVQEIVAKSTCADIVEYTANGWNQIDKILWISTPSPLDMILEHQIKMLLKLMNHFDVGSKSSSQRFPYEFKVFGNIETDHELKHAIEQSNQAFGRSSDDKLPDELRVWICLLDDTIAQFFANNHHILKLCSALLKLYLFGQLTAHSLESLRVVTHHTIRFVTIANPQNDQECDILQKLSKFMNRSSLEGRMAFVDYRGLIDIFLQYWNKLDTTLKSLLAKLPGDYFKVDIEDIRNLLHQCMSAALDKNVQRVELESFCQSFERLLVNLQNLPLDWWLVRIPSTYSQIFICKGTLAVVQNNPGCYRVINVEKFIKLYQALFDEQPLPRHFGIEAVKSQLKSINAMIAKGHWSGGRALSESEQLEATRGLMDLVKSIASYFNKQSESLNFEAFLEKCTEPFRSITSKSTCLADLEVRVRIAGILDATALSSQVIEL